MQMKACRHEQGWSICILGIDPTETGFVGLQSERSREKQNCPAAPLNERCGTWSLVDGSRNKKGIGKTEAVRQMDIILVFPRNRLVWIRADVLFTHIHSALSESYYFFG